ncbi:hypothetical protein [Anaerotignum propionicum]|uniref:Flavodoxin-like domain-containing protein n=1 Tax=Anaerotignum propionicum DSM 1682 TaxID=991789 RepID=A0A0X8VBT7_ANAPI|nr:hypothetical protein [Anaerotignum propionicum]AMJ39947.1 hypothetical protein CPRO_03250 [Anaerotignum propionicum DSM 1682]SHE27146.1 hypothetical protein SAMN02745151_00026 [[Clostridium] propionicum DSM 1682] [Anaerotignum propionicum DSM 1682]
MNIEVRYYSKSGNTKKIADAIAKQAGISAKPIHKPMQPTFILPRRIHAYI